jgi:uncharacterized membrane protein
VSGGKRLKSKSTINLTLAAVFAAVYAVGVVFLAPISFQVFQVRVADALLPLAMIFGWPAVIGFSLGAFVANFFGGLGPVDIIGGSLANLLATYTASKLAGTVALRANRGSRVFLGILSEIAIITLIVGTYLSYLLAIPLEVGLLGIFLGSIVAIGILGTLVFFALSTQRVTHLLRSHGLMNESRERRAESSRS